VGLCFSILPVHTLCFSQSNPLYYSYLPFSLYCILFRSFQVTCSYTDMIYLIIIHTLSFVYSFIYPVTFHPLSFISLFWKYVLCIYTPIYICSMYIYIYIGIYDDACSCIGSISCIGKDIQPLSFRTWLTLLNMMFSSSFACLSKFSFSII
jgi:hypothetical protein